MRQLGGGGDQPIAALAYYDPTAEGHAPLQTAADFEALKARALALFMQHT